MDMSPSLCKRIGLMLETVLLSSSKVILLDTISSTFSLLKLSTESAEFKIPLVSIPPDLFIIIAK
jgi:hypothetical protein